MQSNCLSLLFSCAALIASAPSMAQSASSDDMSGAAPMAMNPGVVRALIAAESETALVAPMTGRIRELSISLGSGFEQGQVLIAFDCSEADARLQIAQGELSGARENYDAKVRLQGLQAAGDVEVKLAAAAVDRGVGQVALSRAQVAHCTMVAPFTGRVAKVHATLHQVVSAGAPLADIISDGPLKARVNAPSRWLRKLRVGTDFSVVVDETGKRYRVEVSAISARVDPGAQTVEIEGRFTKPFAELLPGMSGTAQFKGLR